MRSVIFPLIILMLTAGIALAEKEDKTQQPAEGFKTERIAKMRGGKFSRMFLSMVHKTRGLDLTEEQKNKVQELTKEYTTAIIEEENTSRSFQRQFLKKLQVGEFNAEELKNLSKQAESANLKATDSFVDGVVSIREAIGPKNFSKLAPLTRVNRNALVKLKEANAETKMKSEEAPQKAEDAKPESK